MPHPQSALPTPDHPAAHLLVVEDDLCIREELADGLRDVGFEVETADDGVRALALMHARRPDLLLLDLMMPNVSGWQLIERMQGHPRLSDVPIFVITAARYAVLQPLRYPIFVKPLRLERLFHTIRSFLRHE